MWVLRSKDSFNRWWHDYPCRGIPNKRGHEDDVEDKKLPDIDDRVISFGKLLGAHASKCLWCDQEELVSLGKALQVSLE